MKKDDDFFKQFRSPIPPHLTPEEVEEWEKEMKWQKEEKERIRKSGGYDQVKAGTTFNGEGFSVLVQPTGRDTGQMTITDVQGRQKAFNGRWVCS